MDKTELKQGWRSLVGATLAMIAGVVTLPYYTAGLFIKPLQQEFGWSRAAASLGPAILIAGFVLTSPIIGLMADRMNGRKLVAPGMVAVSFAFAALSQMSGSIAQYYFILASMAVIGNLSGTCALTPILAQVFHRSRGTALGITMGGVGLGAAVGGPVVAKILAEYGWRWAYIAMAAFSLVMAPVVLGLLGSGKHAVVEATQWNGLTLAQSVRKPFYWVMTISFVFVALASVGLIVHFVPLLTDEGMPPQRAAGLASIIGLAVIGSRLFTGLMVDRLFAPRVAAVVMLLGAVGYVVFLVGGPSYTVFGACAIGMTFGAETDLVGYMASRYFGLREYGRVFGVMYGFVTAGSGISPILYGWAKDSTGSYQVMIIAAVVLLTCSALIFALMPVFPHWEHDSRVEKVPGGLPAAI